MKLFKLFLTLTIIVKIYTNDILIFSAKDVSSDEYQEYVLLSTSNRLILKHKYDTLIVNKQEFEGTNWRVGGFNERNKFADELTLELEEDPKIAIRRFLVRNKHSKNPEDSTLIKNISDMVFLPYGNKYIILEVVSGVTRLRSLNICNLNALTFNKAGNKLRIECTVKEATHSEKGTIDIDRETKEILDVFIERNKEDFKKQKVEIVYDAQIRRHKLK